jgi:predicted nucleotide-binding protein (sugar kinase/HSP70/actin superfamily)
MLQDTHANMSLAHRLVELGVTPVESDITPSSPTARIPDFGWDFARTLYARVQRQLCDGIRGVIQVAACNCGCDAITSEYIARLCRDARVPYMMLILDEHTSDGGLQTRLEAFVDTFTTRELHCAACA